MSPVFRLHDRKNDLWLAARFAAEIAVVSDKAITHEKGNYVLEKVIDAGSAADAMTAIKLLARRPYDFAHHKYGVMKFAKGVEKLVRIPADAMDKKQTCVFSIPYCHHCNAS